jgi:signal peptide peptidase SppA
MRYPHLWARLYGAPLLIYPDKAKVIEEVFRSHVLGTGMPSPKAMDDYPAETPGQRAARVQKEREQTYAGIALMNKPEKPYAVTSAGIALIPVIGSLVQRGSWIDAMSGLSSYDRITSLVEAAVADQDVRGILLEIDSPGGEASGIVEMASRIREASTKKPTWAAANGMAYSAAYWVAASAERVYAPITGGVGSIGAVALHVDQSKRDKQMGYTYTFVHAGAKKVDLNSHQELSDRGRARLQSEVDRFYGLFVSDVAKDRGLSAEAVRATQAGLLTPTEAKDGGFIDGIATLRETVALLEQRLQQQPQAGMTGARMSAGPKAHTSTHKKGSTMRLSTLAAAIVAALGLSAESIGSGAGPGARRRHRQDRRGRQGRRQGRRRESRRREGHGGARRGREGGARASRRDPRLRGGEGPRQARAAPRARRPRPPVDDAKKLLAAASKESSGTFAAAMASLHNPKVGAEGERTVTAPKVDSANDIYASRKQAAAAYTK